MAKGIRLFDKKSHFCLYRKDFIQVKAFESNIPLSTSWTVSVNLMEAIKAGNDIERSDFSIILLFCT